MTEPFKLVDIMPDIARKVAADQRHRDMCRDTSCPSCHPEEAKVLRAKRSEMSRQSAVNEVLKWIPPAYAEAELGAEWLAVLVGPTTIARAHEVIGSPRVALVGPPGAGKTSLAAAMYRAVARGEQSTKTLYGYRWVSSHKLAKARAGQPLGEGEAPLVQSCMDASLLVLDELGGEDPRYASAVGEVLFERHEQARPTWVTTGVGPKEIASRYGGGIARRVFEDAAVFRLGGKP